ncbi:MAG TPA: hypothetical protein PKK12_14565, partial [Candidatus Aminicenantes bacterium]|nr:hypothetical protein [Candidatus Aminicenantes bacterium]
SLSSRLFAKPTEGGGSAFELATLTVSQQYYFDPAEANRYRKVDGEYMTFSELSGNLRVRVKDSVAIDGGASYNHYKNFFSRVTGGLDFGRSDAPVGGRIGISLSRSPYYAKNYTYNRTYFQGDLRVNVPGFPIQGTGAIDYDVTEKALRNAVVDLTFDYQCVTFQLQWRVYSLWTTSGAFSQQLNSQIRLGVSLGNLGMASNFFSSNSR